jgi:hypothetical protein
MSDPQLYLLLARIAELTAEKEAAEAEVERLTAERLEIRRLAVEWAHQATDYDDDTEAEIMCGRAILRAMGETLPPHWSDDE